MFGDQKLVWVIDLLFHPVRFIKRKAESEPSFKEPLTVILIIGLFNAVAAYISVVKIAKAFPPELKMFVIVGGYIGAFGAFIMAFFSWVLVTAVFHLFACLMGGRGSFSKMFELTGLSFYPMIFSSMAGLIVMYFFFPGLQGVIQQNLTPFMYNQMQRVIQRSTPLTLHRVFNRFMMFSMVALSGVSVRVNHDLSRSKAALAVLIPLIIYFASTLWLIPYLVKQFVPFRFTQ